MNKYKPLFLFLFGFFIISFIIYNRLIRERLPRSITSNINTKVFILYFVVFLCMATLFLVSFIKYKNYLFYKENNTKSKINDFIYKIYKSKKNPLHFYNDSLLFLDAVIKNNIPMYDNYRTWADFIMLVIGKGLQKYSKYTIKTLCFMRILPQSIVCFALLYDAYNHKFFLFYKTLWILILPMAVRYLSYSLDIFVEKNIQELDKILSLKVIEAKDYNENLSLDDFENITVHEWFELTQISEQDQYICYNSLKDDTECPEQALELMVDAMNDFFTIKSYIKHFELYKDALELPFNCIKYFCYSSCWTYIIYLSW